MRRRTQASDCGLEPIIDDNVLTARHLGEVGIKLIGVYFAVSAVIGIGGIAASLALPRFEGMPGESEMALASVFPVAGAVLAAAVCLLRGDVLADQIFGNHELAFRLSRRDVLVVGLLLVGVSTALGSVPGLVQVVGKAVWHVEGSRQALFWPSMERSWESLVNHFLTFIVGVALAIRAGSVASALDSRDSRRR